MFTFSAILRHHQCRNKPPPVRCSNHRCFYIDQCDSGTDLEGRVYPLLAGILFTCTYAANKLPHHTAKVGKELTNCNKCPVSRFRWVPERTDDRWCVLYTVQVLAYTKLSKQSSSGKHKRHIHILAEIYVHALFMRVLIHWYCVC